jgi:hypothetical protein
MIIQGSQGQTGKQPGQNLVVGLGEFSELLATQLMARYYEQTYRGNVFGVTYTAAALAAPSATATGSFALFNPLGGSKNLVLLKIKPTFGAFTAGTTVTAVGMVPIINQIPTAQTPGNTPRCSLIGSSNTSVATPLTAGTLVAANTVASRLIAAPYLDLAAGDVDDLPADQVEGSVIIQPGSGITFAGIGGTPANLTIGLSLEWMEIPV